MPRFINILLGSPALLLTARLVLTFVFWSAGIAKIVDFEANAAEMESLGLTPGWLINTATFTLQIGGSLMIIFNRGAWLATGALSVFTLLTIPIAHPFWAREGEQAFRDMTIAMEHVSLIGGLMMAAILSRPRLPG